ncbi:MAG: TSUP family transporter, partial [Flavisolibacter sp.]
MSHYEIILFFIIIAFVYASVGFGGGSSYLAILSMYELPFREIRLIALICNIVVVTSGTIIFLLNREINWKKILPLALLSIPMAYLGGSLPLKEEIYFLVLGITLLVASVLLWIKPNNNNEWGDMKTNYVRDGLLGGGIGFLSGMVGIGGGIFLSP